MSTNHKAFHESMQCADRNPFPTPVRSRVYLFMLNGSDVLELGGMLTLRDKLAEAGFAKVYYTQSEDRYWYAREMQRLHRDEPDSRMLLLGYGTAAERTLGLAAEACRTGLPLDGVVFLDPVGVAGDISLALPTPSVALRSHNWPGGREFVTGEAIALAGVGHTSAPTCPVTVHTVVRLMTESAAKVHIEDIRLTLPHLPLRDKPDRTPRGIDPATRSEPTGAWEGFPAMPAHLTPELVGPSKPETPDAPIRPVVPADPSAPTVPAPPPTNLSVRPVARFELPRR